MTRKKPRWASTSVSTTVLSLPSLSLYVIDSLFLFESNEIFQFEQEKDVVTQFKFTTLLMPNGPLKITGLPFDASQYESDFKIECEEIKVASRT